MTTTLERLMTDLQQERLDRASLFWLWVFLRHADDDGQLRSDAWIEHGLREGAVIAGLDATQLEPRMALLTTYHLFQATRLKDQQPFSGDELNDLDWQRKYTLSLTVDWAEAEQTVETLWQQFGAVSPQDEALEKLLAERSSLWGTNGTGTGRAVLLELLHEAQAIYGWLPRPVLTRIAQAIRVPLADVYGVTEFYTMFHTEPLGRKLIYVCQDAPCAVRGAEAVTQAICQRVGVKPNGTTADGEYTVEAVRCLGLCDHAPAVTVNGTRHFAVQPDSIERMLTNEPSHPQVQANIGGLVKIALANVSVVDPTSLTDYCAQGGLAALRQVLLGMTPERVIEIVKNSSLVGRGGAAFPTGLKWEFTRKNPPGQRYVICNADESEVGAFKDRVLMDGDPFRVLEGMLIACYAVGATQAFVYVRGEHQIGYQRFANAIQKLEQAGWLGENIQGSGFTCHIAVRRGAGAYVCGEESALMESIEGKRGFPRLRPPFPTERGLWGKPTVINNVETLAKVPATIIHGGQWYNALGTPNSAGTKLFAVSGSVVRPGVYEIPFGVSLRHLIYDLAGGLPEGRSLQGILTGGAAGTFLKADHLDTPVTFEDFKEVSGTIGAGTLMVFDDTVNLLDVLTRIGQFFEHESCGKCYPCQIGTARQAEILHRLQHGPIQLNDADTLIELGQVMTDTSICGLGQSASWAVADAIKRWPEMFGA